MTTGLTSSSGAFSWVFYLAEMCSAQPRDAPSFSDKSNFEKLLRAIGRGIGNTAAHETGHQINTRRPVLPGMECGVDVQGYGYKACEGDVNSVYEYGAVGQWNFVTWDQPIHWEPTDQCIIERWLLNNSNLSAAECQ